MGNIKEELWSELNSGLYLELSAKLDSELRSEINKMISDDYYNGRA
jgi:hypothetical protein